MTTPLPDPPTAKELRAARLAHVLAAAVRADECEAADVLRVLRHELRRLNTRGAEKAPRRSVEAQRVLDTYGADRPRNGSPDALHADHVWGLAESQLRVLDTVAQWVDELHRLKEVVCVTATENYRLMALERAGVWGDEKYRQADIDLIEVPS
ncbi:hypothetical protein [Phycicoccus sp. DTK01]|uniref:hypothetical protein n=1 Tax=Phycicoccus sp. DTK01 TaxID=2785745 RepID=UPI001A8E0F81|nr:hypothetical protein [Phycicoccus sp. DTK01]GIL34007.1 hypothetical protein PDTK01_00840 [Phycicoccus sp. DTK01]